jgi:hypothetical protein
VPEDGVDEDSADAAVAVRERVDGLELGVDDRGVGERRSVFAIGEGHEVVHQVADAIGRRWDVEGVPG